jgi:serine/threonine-protein kinase
VTDYLHDRVVAAVGDQYLIEAEIGRGGMAAVYRALDLRLHRHVAIKALPPELAFNTDVKTRFLREAQTAAQLSHPNIVPIYTVDERGGVVYFVMALVEGESLAARLARQPRLSIDAVRRLLAEVADALDYAHACGVVHRDIKPDNILLDRTSGRSLVTDFGIAAAAGDARLTLTGVAVGTPAYMSPEQAMGERELDGRSDQYSLGVVAYQMLVGETPFRAANTPAMLVKHLSETPKPIRDRRPDVPAQLAAAIDRALSKKPEARWPSAGALRDALLNDSVAAAPPQAPSPSPALPNGISLEMLRPGEALRRAMRLNDDVLPSLPPLPVRPSGVGLGMSRREWKDWAREQKRLAREATRMARDGAIAGRLDVPPQELRWYQIETRVLRFRRRFVRMLIAVPVLFFINLAMAGFPWFIFPSIFLVLSTLIPAGNLWADGVSPATALRSNWRERIRGSLGFGPITARRELPLQPEPEPAASLVSPEVLASAHGTVVRRAAEDGAQIREIISKLSEIERDMLPGVMPTIKALVDRVASLATTLQRLDVDVSGSSLGALDERIVRAERDAQGDDNDRRLALLRRQRATLHDLLERRRTLLDQMESASLTLQNIKLDLLKLRSAGMSSAMEDVTSATREARALSRDIASLLDAADDVRKL